MQIIPKNVIIVHVYAHVVLYVFQKRLVYGRNGEDRPHIYCSTLSTVNVLFAVGLQRWRHLFSSHHVNEFSKGAYTAGANLLYATFENSLYIK